METFGPQGLVELETSIEARNKLPLQDCRHRIPEPDQDLVSEDIYIEPTRRERFVV